MSRTRFRSSMLALVALTALGAAARAQGTPTLSITAPSTKVINPTNMTVSLQYNLTGGSYAPAEIVFVVPAGAILSGSSFSTATFTHSESPAGTHRWSTTDPFVVDNVGTAGAINLDIDLPTWATLAGTIFTWDADITGSYTPTGGSQTPLAVDAADQTTTALADASLALGFWNTGVWLSKWVTHPTLGPGALVTYDLRPYIAGWQPMAEGYTYEITLGSSLYFIQAFSDFGNNGWPPGDGSLVIDDTPDPDTAGGSILSHRPAGATPGANDLSAGFNSDYPYGHPPHTYVEAFIPCSAIPLGAAYTTDAYQVYMKATGHFRTAAGLGPLQTFELDDQLTSGLAVGNACFTGGAFNKMWDATYGEDRWDSFNLNVDPPKAAQPIDGMIVDLVPSGFTDLRLTAPPSFTAYYCVLPSVGAFTIATFESDYKNDECKTTKPIPVTATTHVVYRAPSWGGGTDGIAATNLPVELFLPRGFVPAGQTERSYTNTAYFIGFTNLDADPELEQLGDTDLTTDETSDLVDPWQSSATHIIVDRSYPSAQDVTDYATNPVTVSPGQFRQIQVRYYIDGNFSPAKNPVVDITVPDGVLIAAPGAADPIETQIQDGGECDPAPGAGHVIEPDPSDRPLTWAFGDAVEPYYQRYYCMRTHIWVYIDPTYPWVDLAAIDFVATIDAANEGTPESNPVVVHFQVTVPPEIQVEVKPACQQVQTSIGVYPPAFVVSTANSSGAPLSGITTTFRIPRDDVDGGTGGATFGGVAVAGAMPPGAVFEVSEDGGGTWAPAPGGPDPDVTHVRLGEFSLAPFSDPLVFFVYLNTTAADDETLVGRATITSDQIAFGDSGPSEPFIVGSCHELAVTKFFDADEDGAFDAGETPLSAWGFEVANDGVVIAAGATAGLGVYSVVVPAATYTVTELMPTGGDPIWAPTTPAAAPSVSQIVTIDDGDASLFFGNSCSCPEVDDDPCTYSRCNFNPRSTTVGTAGNASCDPDTNPTCTPEGVCDDVGCDPATGICTHDGPDCIAVDHYIPVTDAAGAVVGNAHCVLRSGQPPVCDMEGGRLKIIPIEAPGGDGCGLGEDR